MSGRYGAESSGWWQRIALAAAVVAIAGVVWWTTGGSSGREQVERAVVCVGCGYEGTTPVGEAPTLEEWPRECPNCHAKAVYMSQRCPSCGKPIPMKDPNAEQFGTPERCPHCRGINRGT